LCRQIFTPVTGNTGKTAWYIDEFGAVLPVVMIFFAIYFWRRRKEEGDLVSLRGLFSPSRRLRLFSCSRPIISSAPSRQTFFSASCVTCETSNGG
jgi:hypothetical protein